MGVDLFPNSGVRGVGGPYHPGNVAPEYTKGNALELLFRSGEKPTLVP
jgi:hypothetical protein